VTSRYKWIIWKLGLAGKERNNLVLTDEQDCGESKLCAQLT
jgi:hypothetical protein